MVIVIVLAAATVLVGKRVDKLIMSWKNPAYSPAKKFHRVLALGLSDKTVVRVDSEDALAAELSSKGYDAVPGNTIPPTYLVARPQLFERADWGQQIEAVVVLRLVKVDETVTYVPGTEYFTPYPYYNSFYGYYGNPVSSGLLPPATCKKKRRCASKPISTTLTAGTAGLELQLTPSIPPTFTRRLRDWSTSS